jgi:hypothetical protein
VRAVKKAEEKIKEEEKEKIKAEKKNRLEKEKEWLEKEKERWKISNEQRKIKEKECQQKKIEEQIRIINENRIAEKKRKEERRIAEENRILDAELNRIESEERRRIFRIAQYEIKIAEANRFAEERRIEDKIKKEEKKAIMMIKKGKTPEYISSKISDEFATFLNKPIGTCMTHKEAYAEFDLYRRKHRLPFGQPDKNIINLFKMTLKPCMENGDMGYVTPYDEIYGEYYVKLKCINRHFPDY